MQRIQRGGGACRRKVGAGPVRSAAASPAVAIMIRKQEGAEKVAFLFDGCRSDCIRTYSSSVVGWSGCKSDTVAMLTGSMPLTRTYVVHAVLILFVCFRIISCRYSTVFFFLFEKREIK